MVEDLAKPLQPKTWLSTPVTMIARGARTVRVTTPNGAWVADHVIIAMAPTMTAQILFDPVLPVPRNQSVQRTGMGDTIKAFAIYPTPFWRKTGARSRGSAAARPRRSHPDCSPSTATCSTSRSEGCTSPAPKP
jgi:monoamine oxidase